MFLENQLSAYQLCAERLSAQEDAQVLYKLEQISAELQELVRIFGSSQLSVFQFVVAFNRHGHDLSIVENELKLLFLQQQQQQQQLDYEEEWQSLAQAAYEYKKLDFDVIMQSLEIISQSVDLKSLSQYELESFLDGLDLLGLLVAPDYQSKHTIKAFKAQLKASNSLETEFRKAARILKMEKMCVACPEYDHLDTLHEKSGAVVMVTRTPSHGIVCSKYMAVEAAQDKLLPVEMQSIRHPNVCAIYEIGYDSGESLLFYTMEYCLHTDVLGYIKASGKTTPYNKCKLLLDASMGLCHMHKSQIAHGSIQSSHVLVDQSGNAKLTGITWNDGLSGLDFRRFSPTRWASEFRKSFQDDIFAFSLLCGEVFSEGIAPFSHLSNAHPVEVQKAVVSDGERPLEYRDHVDESLWKYMNIWWSDFPGTAEHLRLSLESLLGTYIGFSSSLHKPSMSDNSKEEGIVAQLYQMESSPSLERLKTRMSALGNGATIRERLRTNVSLSRASNSIPVSPYLDVPRDLPPVPPLDLSDLPPVPRLDLPDVPHEQQQDVPQTDQSDRSEVAANQIPEISIQDVSSAKSFSDEEQKGLVTEPDALPEDVPPPPEKVLEEVPVGEGPFEKTSSQDTLVGISLESLKDLAEKSILKLGKRRNETINVANYELARRDRGQLGRDQSLPLFERKDTLQPLVDESSQFSRKREQRFSLTNELRTEAQPPYATNDASSVVFKSTSMPELRHDDNVTQLKRHSSRLSQVSTHSSNSEKPVVMHVLDEMKYGEASFSRDMALFSNNFKPILARVSSQKSVSLVMDGVEALASLSKSIHTRVSAILEEKWPLDPDAEDPDAELESILSLVADAYLDNKEGFQAFVDYARGHILRTQEYDAINKSKEFKHAWQSELQSKDFQHFVMFPIQHILRYANMHIPRLLKNMAPDTAAHEKWESLRVLFKEIGTFVDQMQKQVENLKISMELQSSLRSCPNLLRAYDRILMDSYEITISGASGTLYLYSDIILIVMKLKQGQLLLRSELAVPDIGIPIKSVPHEQLDLLKRSTPIEVLLYNEATREQLVLTMENETANSFIRELRRLKCGISAHQINRSVISMFVDELKYNVQRGFVSRGVSELSLEPGDICFLTKKYENSGWANGMSMRTKKTGVFPLSCFVLKRDMSVATIERHYIYSAVTKVPSNDQNTDQLPMVRGDKFVIFSYDIKRFMAYGMRLDTKEEGWIPITAISGYFRSGQGGKFLDSNYMDLEVPSNEVLRIDRVYHLERARGKLEDGVSITVLSFESLEPFLTPRSQSIQLLRKRTISNYEPPSQAKFKSTVKAGEKIFVVAQVQNDDMDLELLCCRSHQNSEDLMLLPRSIVEE